MIEIRRGLNLPITGAPEQTISNGTAVKSVAVVGDDYHGMKPTMAVQVGDKVKAGQLLFTDKKTEGVRYTAPAAGTISAINRGERRVFQSVVIDLDGDAAENFATHEAVQLASLSRDKVQDNLVQSGLWTALRTRPYSKVPALGSVPNSIFVTAIDTNPLAADPAVILAGQEDDFTNGLNLLSTLTDGKVFVCKAVGAAIPSADNLQVQESEFGGVHPAGNVGTHIHHLDPVSEKKVVWTIGYQDVVAVGQLFTTGKINSQRVIAIGGPQATNPRLVRTLQGASLADLLAGEVQGDDVRVISGSVWGGRTAADTVAYLGRYHNQVSLLAEGRERPFLHYMGLGSKRHSVLPIYISALANKLFNFTTSTNGSERAMVPIGQYEKVMPLDILPTQLLRALIVSDTDIGQKLGCLELDEEDLALCTYVCAGKYEYGPILRSNLTLIEKEG